MIWKKLIVFLLLLFFSSLSIADDAPVLRSSSGTVKPIENPEIELSKELVILYPSTDIYIVDARFELFNYGDSTTISVGFPETKDDFVKNDFLEFTTYVNNEKVEAKPTEWEVIGEGTDNRKTIQRWWVKKVYLPANKYTITRVVYKTKYSIYPVHNFIYYDLSTGRFWKNKIKEICISLRFNENKTSNFFSQISLSNEYDIVTSSSLSEKPFLKDKYKYIFIPIEFERKLNEMKWDLLNYKPIEGDIITIDLFHHNFIGGFSSKMNKDDKISHYNWTSWELSNPFIYYYSLKQNEIKFDRKKFNKIEDNIKKGIKFRFWLRKPVEIK